MGGVEEMTTPGERYRALVQLEDALRAIAWSNGPINKSEFKDRVATLMRHFPTRYDIDLLARRCPDILRDEQ
jgi:hypothetical protein